MNSNSQDVEILHNRQKIEGNPQTKFEIKKIFNKKSTFIYSGVFIALVAVAAFGLKDISSVSPDSSVSAVSRDSEKVALVDDVVEATIIADLADTANLPVAAKASEVSISLAAMQEVAQKSESTISKPQIINEKSSARKIESYVVKDGENVAIVADKYGISAKTLKWANGLKSDEVNSGTTLKILPTDGVSHVVKDDESVQSLAEKYGADAERIVSFNDLELEGAVKNKEIIIPEGVLPEKERPEYEAPRAAAVIPQAKLPSIGTSSNSNLSASVGNKYAYGYCTWYAYERRIQIGQRPIGSFWGNAVSWASSASSAGFVVNGTPEVGSILQNGGGYGHVAIVERVNADGSIFISEMNGPAGWNVIGFRTIEAGNIGSYRYIH